MRALVVALISLALLVPAHTAAAQETPEAFLEKIYAGPDGQPDVGIVERERRADYFTAEVLELMAKVEALNMRLYQIDGLDINPVVPGNDYDVSDVAIEPARIEGGRAAVAVTFLNFGEPERLGYELVRATDGWRIDDIHSADSSFREDLRAAAEE